MIDEIKSASEVATEICDSLGIMYHNGYGCCTVEGIENDESLCLAIKPLEYKGYTTIPALSLLDCVYYGKIAGIGDLITWQSDTIEGITEEFHSCVDNYLEFCKMIGKEPEKPIK